MVIKGQHQSFLISSKKSKQLGRICIKKGTTKSELLRELISAYLEGRVTIENPKEHRFNLNFDIKEK